MKPLLNNDWLAAIITLAAALIWLRINDFAAHRGWISSRLSRKIIHVGTGPIFVLCWLLFSPAPGARIWAALIPMLITIQFILVGVGAIKDDAAVQAMSRTGNPREILRGPLYYGIVFVLLTIIFWLDSPTGIVALMLMCGGDGLADIVGRRWGTRKLPWSPEKSLVGSFGMFAGGWLLATAVMVIFVEQNVFPAPLSTYLPAITWIALAAAIVESFPRRDIDNITITLTAIVLGFFLF